MAEKKTIKDLLEDEIKEHVYEYERHMRASRISGGKEVLEIMITGVPSLPKMLSS